MNALRTRLAVVFLFGLMLAPTMCGGCITGIEQALQDVLNSLNSGSENENDNGFYDDNDNADDDDGGDNEDDFDDGSDDEDA